MISVGHTKVKSIIKLAKAKSNRGRKEDRHTKGIEEQVHPLALVVRERDLLELAIHKGSGAEAWGRLPDPDLRVVGVVLTRHGAVVVDTRQRKVVRRASKNRNLRKLHFMV